MRRYSRMVMIVAVAWMLVTLSYRPSVSAPPSGNILTYAIPGYPATFDPAAYVSYLGYQIFANCYEGLTAYELGTTKLVPGLAESWAASPDLTTYTFKLRPGVKFHDGAILDAEAVKLSMDRSIKLGLSPSVYLAQVKEVVVVDPLTVRINLKQPAASFPLNLPKVYIHGKAHGTDSDWFVENENGTGPYKVVRKEKGQFVLLQRFPEYWKGWPERYLTGIMMLTIPDAGTQKLMLEAGELDMEMSYSGGPDEHPDSLAKKPGIKIIKSQAYRIFIYGMNTQKPGSPLRDKRVRKAIALAFDYDAMPEVFFGNAQVPNGFLPPGFTGHDPTRPKFKRDLAAARRLMTEAGFPQGFAIEGVVAVGEEQGRKFGLVLQASLKEIGIKMDIIPSPSGAIFSGKHGNLETSYSFGLHRLQQPLTADTGAFLRQTFGSAFVGKPYNDSWYSNPEVDRLLDEADRTADEKRRIELWRRAESIIIDDQPVIFLAFPTPMVEPIRDRVMNYRYSPLEGSGVFSLYGVYLR